MISESSGSNKNPLENGFSCELNPPELQERKTNVLGRLFSQIKESRELDNGYSFSFNYSESLLDELIAFIKTEKQCCSFFSFKLEIDGAALSLELSGPPGVKDFIREELNLRL